MKFKMVILVLLVMSALTLVGCQQAASTQTGDTSAASAPANTEADSEAASPRMGGDGLARGLDGVNLLSLGTLNLEATENAVTPEQATKLLPLWQMIQSESLQSAAETDAVVKQIEGLMTEAQMTAIDAMALTFDDYQAWMESQGIEMPAAGEGQGGPGNLQNMSEEDRAKMREQMQSMRDMTPEERATAMAEMGIEMPEGAGEGGFGGGAGGFGGGMRGGAGGNVMLTPLIELLTARAAE